MVNQHKRTDDSHQKVYELKDQLGKLKFTAKFLDIVINTDASVESVYQKVMKQTNDIEAEISKLGNGREQ